MRQHVNPLSNFFQRQIDLPEVHTLFADHTKPLHIDIGCAKGQFLTELALLESSWNYLGIEIREPLVSFAQNEKNRAGLDNLNFLFCNANVSLEGWLNEVRQGILRRVSIQFPDPCFKRKHQKRRVLQLSLLLAFAKSFTPGSELFIQSDIISVMKSMSSLIESTKCFDIVRVDNSSWLQKNPFSVYSERESYALDKGLPVYRRLYHRNMNNLPTIPF